LLADPEVIAGSDDIATRSQQRAQRLRRASAAPDHRAHVRGVDFHLEYAHATAAKRANAHRLRVVDQVLDDPSQSQRRVVHRGLTG